MRRRRLRRALLMAAGLLAAHAALVFALGSIGVAESLLGASPARAVLALVLTVLLFAGRLLLLFVAPGLVLTALLLRER